MSPTVAGGAITPSSVDGSYAIVHLVFASVSPIIAWVSSWRQGECHDESSKTRKNSAAWPAPNSTTASDCRHGFLLKPGDTFGGCDRTNPSYIAPGYYKVFATATGDTSWNTMATDGYSLLSTFQGKMNGLVPNWTDQSGTIPSGADGEYGPDAPRTPWRVATDYVWNGEAKAVTFLDKVATYIDGNKGVQRLFDPNSAYRGGLGLSGLQKTSAKAQEYTDAWLTTSVDDGTYFPGTLRPVYLLLAAQKFSKGCD